MAFSPSSTTRWFLTYTVGAQEHVMQARSTSSATAAEVSAAFDEFLSALTGNGFLTELVIVGLERSASGTNVREPQAWTGAASYGTGTMPSDKAPQYLAFSGRAAGNQQVRVFVYGFNRNVDSNYRLTPAEASEIGDALDILDGLSNIFLSAGLNKPIWKPYANTGYNAYFQRKAREG